MNDSVEKEFYALDIAVRTLLDRRKALASCLNGDDDLIDEIQQITIALYYEVEALKSKLATTTLGKTSK